MKVLHLIEQPTAFQKHKVLKNGSALVLRLDMEDGPIVCKIAHDKSDVLEREAARIQQLRTHYPMLGKRLPEILGQGVIGAGLHRDKSFYLQEFIEGDTLACLLQNGGLSKADSLQILGAVMSSLIDMIDEHDFDPGQNEYSGLWMRDHIREAFHRLLGLEHIGYLTSLDEIIINGKSRHSLAWCLEKIFSSSMFRLLNEGPSTISVLGHWNFHAENIIFEDASRPEGFKIIDPDPKIDVNDPFFGIARLLYSFPHDTAENNRYAIETDMLMPNAIASNEFNIAFTWDDRVIENYAPINTGVGSSGSYAPAFLDNRLAEPALAARLDITFLQCLLRGVAINHVADFRVTDDSLRRFQNKGVFLFLVATDFANIIAERFAE